jgi:hypothetical protein
MLDIFVQTLEDYLLQPFVPEIGGKTALGSFVRIFDYVLFEAKEHFPGGVQEMELSCVSDLSLVLSEHFEN